NFVIAARAAQGIGGMLLAPASLALIASHFSGEERAKAVGTWSAMTAITTTIGPVAGGILIDHFTWRSVFLINVPVAAAVLIAAVYLEDARSEETGRLDFTGAILVTLGFGGIVYALIASQTAGWHAWSVWLWLILGIASLGVFYAVEHRVTAPLVPPAIFKSRPFVALNAATFLLYGALGGFFFFFPFLLVQVYDYSVTAASFAFLPFILIVAVLSRTAGALSVRYGARSMIVVGTIFAGLGFGALGVLQHMGTYWSAFLPGAVLLGFGMSITVTPLTNGVMETATPEHMGMASGFNNAVSRIAGMLAIAALGAILVATFNSRLDKRLASSSVQVAQRRQIDAQRDRLAGAQIADRLGRKIVRDSYADGFTVISVVSALLAFGATVVVFGGLRKGEATSKDREK
ncbi:MAG: MFS transporter, partial [Candidatus Eremiobacteraeota bacterium]|nr:MFS transporter [Candidatus Eremiobacteraeota bacterium]